MDSKLSAKSNVATFRKSQKRRRSPEQEEPRLPECDLGTSGECKNMRNRTDGGKDSSQPSERRKIKVVKRTGVACESNTGRKRRGTASTSKNTASDRNCSVTHSVQHENAATDRYSHRKRKRSQSFERNSSLDLPSTSRRGRNERSSNVSEGPAEVTTERASTSRSSDHEASRGGPSVSRRDERHEGRTRRISGLRDLSNRFVAFSLDIRPANEITIMAPSIVSILCNLTEDMVSSYLQGMYRNIENFLWSSVTLDSELNSHGLSTAQINRLPTHCYSETSISGQEGTFHASECQICLSAYREHILLRTLPCLHDFHTSCIDKWLKMNGSCPVCRALVADPEV